MKKHKVFIDGSEGTTGLQIHSQLEAHSGVELLRIDEALRKDSKERSKLMNEAELVFLCLPDAAAAEAVSLVTNPGTKIIDCSTAHRTASGWVYGFPELSAARREEIKNAKRVSNPGCHASGVIALIAPLINAGIVPPGYPLAITSLTGYSGGGKNMIAKYERPDRDEGYAAPRLYGLNMYHKHIREILAQTGLTRTPAFSPVICDYYSGMEIIVPLMADMINADKNGIFETLRSQYNGSEYINVTDTPPEDGYVPSNAFIGTNNMEIIVTGSDEIIQLIARFDNLGKGASGAAVQNMGLMLNIIEERS